MKTIVEARALLSKKPRPLMADDKLVVASASSSSLQKRSDNDQLRVQDKQHYIDLPQVDSRHKPTVSVATSNTRFVCCPV